MYGHQYLARIYSAENGYIGAAFSLERIVSGFVGERKDLCVEVRNNETGEVKIHQGTRKSGISTTCVYPLKYTNAQIYVSMDEGMLDPGGTFGTLLLMGVMMLAIASILMAIGLQGKTVFAPLEQLRRAMEQYSTGDLDVRLPERENVSQIGQLYQTFNHMADQIQILRIDVYEKELERQRARSRFLQVQIQPHFYTNILNLIHGMAQIQDFEEIQKLCRVSAAYFRYLMGQKGTFVPLKEELRCLTSYIEIQHCRYKDMLEIQVNVEPEMEDEMILPLVIQTFVGNSVKHNIMLVPHLEIELTVKREGEHDLLILIEDNGLGFKKEILDKINRNESIEEEGEHIGIQEAKSMREKNENVKIQVASVDDAEELLVSAKAKKRSLLADKITGDNIYKALVFFDKLYAQMNEAEKREFLSQLVDNVQIYEERKENGQWLKSIEFKLPIIEKEFTLSLDNDTQNETVVGLHRKDM